MEKALLEQRVTEIREFLQGTILEDSPICPVSSQTGEGFEDFYNRLVEAVTSHVSSRGNGIFRMPIAQFFSRPGSGTVVTGIPVDGTISVNAQVELMPGGLIGHVRGIQRFLRAADDGGCGQCLALNIPELSRQELTRGQVVSSPGYLKPVRQVQVRLSAIARLAKPLQNAELVKFHTGTSETGGKLYLLEDKVLSGGQQGFATMLLDNPVSAAACDRFILRRMSPAMTVAGGTIMEVREDVHRLPRREQAASLLARHSFLGEISSSSAGWWDRRIEYYLLCDRPAGAAVLEISKGTLLPPDAVRPILQTLTASGRVLDLQDEYFIHQSRYQTLCEAARRQILEASDSGQLLSLRREELRRELNYPEPLWNRMLQELERAEIIRAQGHRVVLSAAAERIEQAEGELLQRLLEIFDRTGFRSPRPDELPGILNQSPEKTDRLLEHLCGQGKLVSVSKNVVLSAEWLKLAQAKVVAIITGMRCAQLRRF